LAEHHAPSPGAADVGQQLLAAARGLAPRIEADTDRIERDRRAPPELIDALVEAGLFRSLLARSLGGFELDLPTHVRIVEELARADASIAWCIGQANGLLNYISYAEPRVVREVFADGRTILANGPGENNQPGRAVSTDGGYRIGGKWMFASGIMHANWLLAVCNLFGSDDEPMLDEDDMPAQRLMLIPKSSAALHDVWHVSGLRGTGSQSFSVTNLFVAADHVIRYAPQCRRESGPLYLFSNNGVFGPSFAAVALGAAHSSLRSIVDFAAGKIPRGMERTIRENAVVQSSVAQAHARLGAARNYLHQTLSEVWSEVCASGSLEVSQRVAVRLAAIHATHEAAAVVDTAYTLAGSNAIFEDRPFERRFRDVHAVTQQLQGRRAHYENAGAYLLGLEPNLSFL
jgi:alkylation response protein AidB-like acyl-CoA dehydrogenase